MLFVEAGVLYEEVEGVIDVYFYVYVQTQSNFMYKCSKYEVSIFQFF